MKITDDILGGPNFWPRWSTDDLYITTMEWFDLAQWIKDKKRTLSPTLQKQFESWGEDTNQLIVLCRKRLCDSRNTNYVMKNENNKNNK